jgi:hypothetical protein
MQMLSKPLLDMSELIVLHIIAFKSFDSFDCMHGILRVSDAFYSKKTESSVIA